MLHFIDTAEITERKATERVHEYNMIFDQFLDLNMLLFCAGKLMCTEDKLLHFLNTHWKAIELHLQVCLLVGLTSAMALRHITKFLLHVVSSDSTDFYDLKVEGRPESELFPGRASGICT